MLLGARNCFLSAVFSCWFLAAVLAILTAYFSIPFFQTRRVMAQLDDQPWRSFSQEKLAEIEAVREAARQRGHEALRSDPKGTYGRVCPACKKPNAPIATFCTGCSFPVVEWDLQRLPDNIFLDLVNGKDIGTTVYFRDANYLVFDDKYGVSDNHLDVIPSKVIEDISCLTAADVPMLKDLYELGKQEFIRRKIPAFTAASAESKAQFNLDDFIVSGYNYPVSVKHLHLHMVLPPFRHDKVFAYPRFHPHKKVIADLLQYGRVRTYDKFPSEEERKAHYDNFMANHQLLLAAAQ